MGFHAIGGTLSAVVGPVIVGFYWHQWTGETLTGSSSNFAGRTSFSQDPEMGSGTTSAQGFFEEDFQLSENWSKKEDSDHLPDQQLPHVAGSTDEHDPPLPQGISRIEFSDDRFCFWNDGSFGAFMQPVMEGSRTVQVDGG